MEPRVVEEAGGTEEMPVLALLLSRQLSRLRRVWGGLWTLAQEVEALRAHVHVLAIAREHVWQSNGHVQHFDLCLEALASLWVLLVQDGLRQLSPSDRIEPQHSQAAVNEHGSARDAVEHVAAEGRVVLDQNTAVHGPHGLDLLEGHDPSLFRSRPEPPSQLPVRGAQAVDPSVGRSEHGRSSVERRWRVDAPARGEGPENLPRTLVQGIEPVRIDRGHEHLAIGRDDARELAAQLRSPRLGQLGRYVGRRASTTSWIMSVRQPPVRPTDL